MSTAESLSFLSLVVSFFAFYFAFAKESHRLSIGLVRNEGGYGDFISISNRSPFPVMVSSVGHIDCNGLIEWQEVICDAYKNDGEPFPITIKSRSIFEGSFNWAMLKRKNTTKGYCVQLACGRTFVNLRELPYKVAFMYYIKSKISRFSGGYWGFEKSNAHLKKYGM